MSVVSVISSTAPPRCLVFAVLLLLASSWCIVTSSASRVESNCSEPHSPFPDRMSGKVYTRLDDCKLPKLNILHPNRFLYPHYTYHTHSHLPPLFIHLSTGYRPRADSSLRVYRKSFLLTPFNGDPFISCKPYYRVVVRTLPENPYIVSFPGINFNEYDDSKSCFAQQRAKRSKLLFPRGRNRARYARIIREILKELEKISNFECGETKDGFIIVKPGRNFDQVDVELVIGYVRTIAFMYDICLK